MKIVVINGQNHKGSTYHVGRIIADKILANRDRENNSIVEFFLPRDLNHFCIGCYKCIEDETVCPCYIEKKKIVDEIESAELLIVTSPCYCLLPSAPIKAFIDLTFDMWVSHRPKASMFSKKAIVVSTAAGIGTIKTTKDIKRSLFYWGIPYIKTYGVNVRAKEWKAVPEKIVAKIDKDTTRLAKKVSRVAKPHVGFKTRFVFGVCASMNKANMSSSPVEKQYWEDKGWLGKKRPWNN